MDSNKAHSPKPRVTYGEGSYGKLSCKSGLSPTMNNDFFRKRSSGWSSVSVRCHIAGEESHL